LFQAASLSLQGGDPASALRLLDRLAALQPFSAEQAALRAVALQATGQTKPAEEVLQRAIAEEPYYFQSYGLLGQLWAATGRTAQAREYFAGLVERMPDSRLLRSTYAQLLAAEGSWPLAETQWREVLRLVPDDESALTPLLRRLSTTGRNEAALVLMQVAHAYNPRSFANNQRLVEYYDGRNEPEQTVALMQDLAESGPVNALLFRDLAVNLEKLGRAPEMRDALLRGRRVAQQEGETELLAEFNRLLQRP
jgi:tetratricopeptide (TPR) repeat protein